jgi:hypothetical protein
MNETVMLLITSRSAAVFQQTNDGGLKIFANGMVQFVPVGEKLLIKDIEWIYEVDEEHKAACTGRSFVIKLTLRDDEFEIFQTAETLPSSGRVAGSHYLAQGLEIAHGPSLRMKMWFGGLDSGLDKGVLRILLRGRLVIADRTLSIATVTQEQSGLKLEQGPVN